MKYALVLLLLTVSTSQAESWDTTDKALGVAAVTALSLDWGQTRYIAQSHHGYYEHNVVLGDHPSSGRVDAYFVSAIVGTLLIGNALAPRHRKAFFIGVIAFELIATTRNRTLGIKVSF